MQVNNISPAFTGREFNITPEMNKGRKFLYNEVVDIIRETPVPAVFSNEGIKISAPESQSLTKVLGNLAKSGINFETIA